MFRDTNIQLETFRNWHVDGDFLSPQRQEWLENWHEHDSMSCSIENKVNDFSQSENPIVEKANVERFAEYE